MMPSWKRWAPTWASRADNGSSCKDEKKYNADNSVLTTRKSVEVGDKLGNIMTSMQEE